MVSVESLIEHYGYFALLGGAFLEGETVVALAGFAARRGYLALPWVILFAFLGSLAGDQLWFYVGRRKGRNLIATRPRWMRRAERVQGLLSRYELAIVLGFRFMYGFRNLTPLVLGASNYSPVRFAVLNIIGAAIWSILVAIAGYAFGGVMEIFLADIKRYERWLLCFVVMVGLGIWLYRTIRERRKSPPPEIPPLNDN